MKDLSKQSPSDLMALKSILKFELADEIKLLELYKRTAARSVNTMHQEDIPHSQRVIGFLENCIDKIEDCHWDLIVEYFGPAPK